MAYSRLMPVFATEVLHGGVHKYGFADGRARPRRPVCLAAVAARGRRPGARRRLYLAVATSCAGSASSRV